MTKKATFKQFLEANVSRQDGFTLVEMLIVITLIALVGTFGVGKIIEQFDSAKVKATTVQMQQLGVVLDTFKIDCGRYPTTEEGLDALVEKPPSLKCRNYAAEGYVKDGKLPKDGFDNDFLYLSDAGSKYELVSLGQGGEEGGDGPAADISSRD